MICKKCHIDKPESEFASWTNNKGRIYRRCNCRKCLLLASKLWRQNNIEKARARDKKYSLIHKEKIRTREKIARQKPENKAKRKELMSRWYQKNKDKVLAVQKEKYQENRNEKLLYAKTYRQKNKGKVNRCNKLYYQKTPKYRISMKIASGIRKTIHNNKSKRHWETLVDYTITELMNHLESQFKEGMSWDNYGKWHIDHIRPVSSFNFTRPECDEFKQCWALDNLQPLWAVDNLRKHNKWIIKAA